MPSSLYQLIHPWHWLTYGQNATGLGLLGLAWYCLETFRIRRGTLAQSEASRRPFFAVGEAKYGLRFINKGVGIALKVHWTLKQQDKVFESREIGALSPDMYFILSERGTVNRLAQQTLKEHTLHISYSDTAGKQYWTVINSLPGDDWHFHIDTGASASRLQRLVSRFAAKLR